MADLGADDRLNAVYIEDITNVIRLLIPHETLLLQIGVDELDFQGRQGNTSMLDRSHSRYLMADLWNLDVSSAIA